MKPVKNIILTHVEKVSCVIDSTGESKISKHVHLRLMNRLYSNPRFGYVFGTTIDRGIRGKLKDVVGK